MKPSPLQWLFSEFSRARERNAKLPNWAKPIVTTPKPYRSRSDDGHPR